MTKPSLVLRCERHRSHPAASARRSGVMPAIADAARGPAPPIALRVLDGRRLRASELLRAALAAEEAWNESPV